MAAQYDIPSKQEMIDFIIENFGQNNQRDLTTLRGIKNTLQGLIGVRQQELTEMGVYHDDWLDDEILGQIENYLDLLDEKRVNNETENIKFSKDVSLATRNTALPDEMRKKIIRYGVTEPENADPMFGRIDRTGGKSKKRSRKSMKSKRKSRRNKKNTRKNRKHRK